MNISKRLNNIYEIVSMKTSDAHRHTYKLSDQQQKRK